MHEFSLASELVSIAEKAAADNHARAITEISIEIGSLSGVDADAFAAALELVCRGSLLEKSRVEILRIKGKGFCAACASEFEMEQRFDCCPACRSFPSVVRGGTEFRIGSFVIESLKSSKSG